MPLKYLKLKSVKGAKKAIVAIARKLIIKIPNMLLHDTPYIIGNQETCGDHQGNREPINYGKKQSLQRDGLEHRRDSGRNLFPYEVCDV